MSSFRWSRVRIEREQDRAQTLNRSELLEARKRSIGPSENRRRVSVGKLDGKVAFVTGGARGQGRSHAVHFAREGADVIVIDICEQIPSVEYAMSTLAELEETARMVREAGGRLVAVKADVRELDSVTQAVERGMRDLGRLDIVVANAGIMATTGKQAKSMDAWHVSIATMLTGVYHTLAAAMQPMIDAGRGGSMVVIGSTAGQTGFSFNVGMLNPGEMGYAAAKHGVVGLMRNFARALGPYGIRVNCVHPMGVRTPMVVNEFYGRTLASAPAGWLANCLQIDLLEPQDVSNAVTWLCSEESRYITGSSITVDAGRWMM
jgi:SDR family mycofactocin-dependent oxidoreductase